MLWAALLTVTDPHVIAYQCKARVLAVMPTEPKPVLLVEANELCVTKRGLAFLFLYQGIA